MENETNEHIGIFNKQIKELLGTYHDIFASQKISENEFWIWYALISMNEECTQQDIIRGWALSKQTVNSVISSLVKRGYVRLEALPNAKNSKLIRLTEDGRKYGEGVMLPVFDAERKALSKISNEEKSFCMTTLDKYTKYLKGELTNGTTEES